MDIVAHHFVLPLWPYFHPCVAVRVHTSRTTVIAGVGLGHVEPLVRFSR